MKRTLTILGVLVFVGIIVTVLIACLIASAKNPEAMIRVVDAASKPIAGAIIDANGLRTKDGPYQANWYRWPAKSNSVKNLPITTGDDGVASVPYPKYVFEQIETGTICFSVSHRDFVTEGLERVVSTSTPAGAPLGVRLAGMWNWMRSKFAKSRPRPVVMQRGAILNLLYPENADDGSILSAQISNAEDQDFNFWDRSTPGKLTARKIPAGKHWIRALRQNKDESVWFSAFYEIIASPGRTNDVAVKLKPGVTLRGELADTVPRPVSKGRVVINVWPHGIKAADGAPRWHAWSPIREDGSFEIRSLPEGELEVVALSDGFISESGPGVSRMLYPQTHSIGSNDLTITVEMQQTACLEVWIKDDHGLPVNKATISTCPNVRYGDYLSTILMDDCYNDADNINPKANQKTDTTWGAVRDFNAVTDTNGYAILPNLPGHTDELSVEHPQFALPPTGTAMGGQSRSAQLQLITGKTNRVYLRLEPRSESVISHY